MINFPEFSLSKFLFNWKKWTHLSKEKEKEKKSNSKTLLTHGMNYVTMWVLGGEKASVKKYDKSKSSIYR